MISSRFAGPVICAMLAVVASTARGQPMVDLFETFENVPPPRTTPLTLTHGWLTATYTSDGPFSVIDEFQLSTVGFNSLAGNVLADTDPEPHELRIHLNRWADDIMLYFALNAPVGSMTIRLLFEDYETFSRTIEGVIPPGYLYPEGRLFIASHDVLKFDNIVLTSTAPNFAIDNLGFYSQTIPEPSTIWLVAGGAALLLPVGLRWHRSRRPSDAPTT